MAYTNIFYVLASVLFILGIKKLSHPRTARNGNMIAFTGMMIAIVATLIAKHEFEIDFQLIAAGIVVGIIICATFAIKVEMTQMPQMVAIFNGFGGGASALVAAAEFLKTGEITTFTLGTIVLSVFVGTLTFTGSFIALANFKDLSVGSPLFFQDNKSLMRLWRWHY